MSTALATPRANRPGPVAHAARRNPRAEADYRRGLEFSRSERWEQAAAAFAQATRRNPQDAVFWLNLAHAHVKVGRLDEAADEARRAVALDPHSELAVSIATQCLAASNRHDEMIAMLQRLDLENVRAPNPHFSLGQAYAAMNRYPEAVDAYLAALARKPDFMPGHVYLGNVFERLKLHVEARECFQTALAVGGRRAELLSAMTYQSQNACRWDLFAQDLAQLQEALQGGQDQPAPFHLLTMPSSRAQQRAAAAAHWRDHCAGIVPLPRPAPRIPGAPLRIGYFTNDIFRHATAYLIAEMLERHDRVHHRIFLYSYGHDDGSPIRARIMNAAGDGFVDVARLSDRAVAERMRADNLDLLVDLKGYTLGSRIRVCAYHPARVQVNYLGYPGTLGTADYDYIIGDRIVTPLEHAPDFAEHIAQMPRCYQPNDRQRALGPAPSRADCGLPPSGFVFCSFNSCYKITREVFDRWCRLLLQVPGSVLWLYEANAQARANLEREAQTRGVDALRLIWAPHRTLEEHLARLQLADLVLDTLPVNAHTTASDALWAGVPMVTTPGDSFVARVATSVLEACELPELVAPDGAAYEKLALELATDAPRLQALRARLAGLRAHCALFDSATHTRALEALYARMMARWEAGLPPEALPALEGGDSLVAASASATGDAGDRRA